VGRLDHVGLHAQGLFVHSHGHPKHLGEIEDRQAEAPLEHLFDHLLVCVEHHAAKRADHHQGVDLHVAELAQLVVGNGEGRVLVGAKHRSAAALLFSHVVDSGRSGGPDQTVQGPGVLHQFEPFVGFGRLQVMAPVVCRKTQPLQRPGACLTDLFQSHLLPQYPRKVPDLDRPLVLSVYEGKPLVDLFPLGRVLGQVA